MFDDVNPIEQTQKHIDNFLKYVQTEIDILYGVNNDNSDTEFPLDQLPIQFMGKCIRIATSKDISGNSPNGFNGDCYFTYDLTVRTDGGEMVSNLNFLGGTQGLQENVDNTYYLGLWDDFQDISYSVALKSELVGGQLFIPNDADNYNSFYKRYHVFKNDFDYTAIVQANFIGQQSHSSSNFYICPWDVTYSLHDSSYSHLHGKYVTVNSNGIQMPSGSLMGRHLATTEYPSLMVTTSGNTVINNYTTYGGNTYNDNSVYTNNQGDTINTYYGDNYIVLAPVVGAGGIANFNLNFDDLVGALQLAVDDLNINFGLSGSDALYVPTYDELKYEDMGSFYITPIKQIPTLPLAPDLADTVIDISEPVGVLSDGFGGLIDAYDTLGLTLMIGFTFIARLCIRKLRGE